jgi:hypothetical protein
MDSMTEWLSSEETGEPFSHCICCKIPLLEIAAPWLVNKDYHRNECVLEYAICQFCRDRFTDELSEESKEAVRSFLENEIDWAERVKEFMLSYDLTERFDACIACRSPRSSLEGFSISALFDADGNLVLQALPLLICRRCIGTATRNLSDQSRRKWRAFLDLHFEGPPDDTGFPGLL